MTSLKRAFIVSSSFGAGFAIMLSLIGGGIFWYKSQPKPWNKIAITATFDDVRTSKEDDTLHFDYILENHTDIDYNITDASDVIIFFKHQNEKGLAGPGTGELLSLYYPVFIPAKQRRQKSLNLRFMYEGEYLKPNSSREEQEKYRKKLKNFVKKRFQKWDGFVLFDKINRFQIEFPKGW